MTSTLKDYPHFFISTEPGAGAPDPVLDPNITQTASAGEASNESEDDDQIGTEEKGVSSSPSVQPPSKKVKLSEFSEHAEKHLEKFLFGAGITKPIVPKVEDALIPEDKFGKALQGQTDPAVPVRKPAWEDKADQTTVKEVASTYAQAHGKHGSKDTSTDNYSNFIRKKFLSIVGTPKWADLSVKRDHDDEDSDDEFFRETTDMLEKGHQESIAKGRLESRKLKDLNMTDYSQGSVITATEFHPKCTVSLVAGQNGTATLFQVDGKRNPKMQSVNFKDFPIKTAHFSADGSEFIVGSQHFGHFYTYNMEKGVTSKIQIQKNLEQFNMQKFEVSPAGDLLAFQGRFGSIHFLHARCKTRAFSLKMNDDVKAMAFSPDGKQLYSHGGSGEVYIWDIGARDCVHRFYDDGCIEGTALAVSPDSRFLATGSTSGVVNVYSKDKLHLSRPKPDKILLNLTTSINEVRFNPTSEILAARSMFKENGVKLLHVPSMTTFENFPSWNFNFKRPNSFGFSLNGGYFSIGNNHGAANLYRLKHYQNY
ncbi:U3 small nucleolar RNA-associated protein 18 homolog [Tigriopus californicus]|uniref:U3 small nucleolar RNA-associated protein 18 homolog n=1 Tax=Tigriopus californicus TaxID=6832 RepID=UPI0027DA4CED|nr:U3 small nucleolar RNA-associated protein 18 homolog [Tigriopus californicus]